jgi:hypothetical protein
MVGEEVPTMANQEHLQILKQGIAEWNAWRDQNRDITPDLFEADLTGANLFEADLRAANLIRANLCAANLAKADLYQANLIRADLIRAIIGPANFNRANLTRANLTRGHLFETVFSDTNLTAVRGLETCVHEGPSTLDHRTLARSGPLPLAFLRGCGLPDALIDYLVAGAKLSVSKLVP